VYDDWLRKVTPKASAFVIGHNLGETPHEHTPPVLRTWLSMVYLERHEHSF
jgi:hypothetical protein